MDILISSNLERLLYYASDGAAGFVAGLMGDLAKTGRYQVPDEVLARIQETFACGWASDEQAEAAMKECHDATGYVLDPHTACAWHVSKMHPHTKGVPRVVLSTASPYKFCHDVCEALGLAAPQDDFACMREIEGASETKAPAALAALENADERFGDVIAVGDMSSYVETKRGELL